MIINSNLHSMTHNVMDDLLKAVRICHDKSTEGLLLSAITTARMVHDELMNISLTAESDPEEYCAAI